MKGGAAVDNSIDMEEDELIISPAKMVY